MQKYILPPNTSLKQEDRVKKNGSLFKILCLPVEQLNLKSCGMCISLFSIQDSTTKQSQSPSWKRYEFPVRSRDCSMHIGASCCVDRVLSSFPDKLRFLRKGYTSRGGNCLRWHLARDKNSRDWLGGEFRSPADDVSLLLFMYNLRKFGSVRSSLGTASSEFEDKSTTSRYCSDVNVPFSTYIIILSSRYRIFRYP